MEGCGEDEGRVMGRRNKVWNGYVQATGVGEIKGGKVKKMDRRPGGPRAGKDHRGMGYLK